VVTRNFDPDFIPINFTPIHPHQIQQLTEQTIGYYFKEKTQQRLNDIPSEDRPHYVVAKQLRKQGVPLDIALLMIFGK
jgi:hypothetical protein